MQRTLWGSRKGACIYLADARYDDLEEVVGSDFSPPTRVTARVSEAPVAVTL